MTLVGFFTEMLRADQVRAFISNIRFLKILLLVLFINFSVDSAVNPIMVNVLDTRIQELVNILAYHHLQKKEKVKPKNSSVANHLLFCNHSASYDDFSILKCENKKFLLEFKKSPLIMRDKPSLISNITSAPLYLFDRPQQ